MIIGVGAPIEGQLLDPPVGVSTIATMTPAHEPAMPGGLKTGDYLLVVGAMAYQSTSGAVGMEPPTEPGWHVNHTSFSDSGIGYSWGFVRRAALLDADDYPTIRVDRATYNAPGDVTYCGYMIAIRHADLAIIGGGPPYGSFAHPIENPSPASTPAYKTPVDNVILFSHAIHMNRTEVPAILTDGVFNLVDSHLPVLPDGLPHSLAVASAPSSALTYDGPQWEASTGNLRVAKSSFVNSYTPPSPRQQAILV